MTKEEICREEYINFILRSEGFQEDYIETKRGWDQEKHFIEVMNELEDETMYPSDNIW